MLKQLMRTKSKESRIDVKELFLYTMKLFATDK